MENNVYTAPAADLNTKPSNEISSSELAAFAGGEHYPRVLMGLLDGSARHAGFNIWAALFGMNWYFYRKLYLFGLFSGTLEALLPYAFFWSVGKLQLIESYDYRLVAGMTLFLLMRIVIGYMANIALGLKAVKVIEEVDAMNKDNETHLRLIAHAGGVSMPSLLGLIVVLGCLREMA